jgi:hypothetical protein
MATGVKVVPHQGRTAISVDGRPIPGMSYVGPIHSREDRSIGILREMADAGVRIFFCPWGFRRSRRGPTAWAESGDLDFGLLDEGMETLASLCDDLWIVPRIYLDTPHWWARRYPQELVLFSDSNGIPAEPTEGHRNLAQASMASQRWRQDVSALLRRLVEHVESGPHADRVLGYMLNSGGTEEWVYWGAQQGKVPDYSLPALNAFQQWLRERYGDAASLAAAWNIPSADFDSTRIPSAEERRTAHYGLVRDPRRDGPSVDYDLFLSDLCAGTLLHFCRVVKEATERRRLTGSFYGYCLWQTGFMNSVVPNGHAALRKLLESPDIDFVTGITSYDNREPGGPGSFMLPVESVQAAGKLVFNEVDVRTHLTRGSATARFESDRSGPRVLNIWPLDNPAESVAVYRREFAHHLIHGAAWWYFDMQGGWYSCPELLDEFSVQSKIARQALDWDMGSVAEVAAVVSEGGLARHALFRMHDVAPRELTDLQCDRATANLYKAGFPVDWWMMEDLGLEELRRYKVIYFHNATFLSDEERSLVEGLKRDGRTLIFIGLPGLLTEEGRSAEAAASLTGTRCRICDQRQPALLDIVDYNHDVTAGCRAATTLGTGALLSPCLAVDDPASTTLAVWRMTGQPAACVRDFGTWRSVFFGVPPNNAAVFRSIARTAGCHVWYQADGVVFANRSLLALHLTNHSDRVSLPRPMTVTDLFGGSTIAREAVSFVPHDSWDPVTHLWRLEPAQAPVP